MTKQQRDELREKLAKATPLPWGYDSYSTLVSGTANQIYSNLPNDASEEELAIHEPCVCQVDVLAGDTATPQGRANAEAIEAGMNALPALLDRDERCERLEGLDWNAIGNAVLYVSQFHVGQASRQHAKELAVAIRAALEVRDVESA